MKKNLIISAIGVGICFGIWGQDIHFSQMQFSPLTLNPALAGANYDVQATFNYRSQWNSVASPYRTMAASFDARFNPKSRTKKAHVAAGINFFNDQAGEIRVGTNNVNLSVATHVFIGKNSTIGAGLMAGWMQRSILPIEGRWNNQYDGMAYDGTLPSGESFNQSTFSTFDMGAGLVYTFAKEEQRLRSNNSKFLNIGFSAFHLNRPKYSFMSSENERMYVRFSTFINGSIGIRNTHVLVEPGIWFHNQGNARELLYGSYFRYIIVGNSRQTGFVKKTSAALGLFVRNQDALIVKALIDWNGLAMGFAYDINLSQLTRVSKARGGLEIVMRYVVGDIYHNRTSSTYRRRR